MHIVTTHKNTDFDALASVIAATLLYPGSISVLPKNLNPNVKAFLSIHKDLLQVSKLDDINPAEITRLIVVDVNSWERLDRMSHLKDKADLEIFLWDHHTNEGDITANFICQEAAGATVTLLVRQLRKEGKLLTPIQATLMLAGIYEDTGNLTFPSTRAEDAYAAAYLLDRKADLNVISTFLRPAYGEKQKNILFKMLQTAKRIKINGHSVSINKIDVEGHVDSLAVVVRMYMDIVNVDVAFGIFSDAIRGRCMVIGRSSVEGFDVGSVTRSMGGGGHPNAGAALLKSVNPDAVEKWIKELIRGNQQASVQISDLMSFPVITVTEDTSMGKVARILKEKGCTGLPVVSKNRLVGMISRRDFRKIKKESQLNAPVKAFMTTKILTIEPGKSPMQAARLMVKHDIGRLPVVENDRIIGIITRSDAMLYFYDLLPD
ncbi:MAG: CBS domain-containing protein [Desulfobacterales bacterium]|nr:MAG: CBS domain-containing protein [Desulfobacterales bacterium]